MLLCTFLEEIKSRNGNGVDMDSLVYSQRRNYRSR